MIKHICALAFMVLFTIFFWFDTQASLMHYNTFVIQQDTIEEDKVSAEALMKINNLNTKVLTSDSINIDVIKFNPYVHVGEFLKGNVSGVLVQNPSAEPGSFQNILVRGLTRPLLNNNDVNSNLATVYVNGIPLIVENNFSSQILSSDITRIGTSTDYYSSIDLSTIKSIEVIKDPVRLAELGPLAANGAIWITTYGGISSNALIEINAYTGVNMKPQITPTNADYENRFRRQFYNLYRQPADDYNLRYPVFLSDSTNRNYYGFSDWGKTYFSNSLLTNVDMNIRGGVKRANFAVYAGTSHNSASSDDVGLSKYNFLFNLNMLPFEFMDVSTYINVRRTKRDRNRNLRDRFLEMAYFPDLTTPISPNNEVYSDFVERYDREILDDNITNHFQGNIKISSDLFHGLKFITSFMIDFNEGRRNLFYPKNLMETINYQSGYYGYSQRYIFSNSFQYKLNFNNSNVSLTAGTDYQQDVYRFNFVRAYDGPNDFLKLNTYNSGHGSNTNMKVFPYNNKETFGMQNFYGTAGYSYNKILDLKAVVRWDGSSSMQRDNIWLLTPGFSAQWHIDNNFGMADLFKVRASFARIAIPNFDSRFAYGPQFRASSLGWNGEPTIYSYYGTVGLTRNYNDGWIGYNMDWAYRDNLELAIEKSFLKSRINLYLSLYQNTAKNQLIDIPVPSEYGYTSQYKNGMDVKNTGIDVNINAVVVSAKKNKVGWKTALNFNINNNELMKLPEGLDELVVGDRLLKVGESVDSYWLYTNQGIYKQESEVPVVGGRKLNMDGLNFSAGDAVWADLDNNGIINTDDKVLKGKTLPLLFGGFNNTFNYNKLQLDFGFTYSLGNKILNQRAANRYNFISSESGGVNAVKEIFNWQEDVDLSKYPVYNVWSDTNPYRLDQDLFLEDASYLKLRNVTLAYDFGYSKMLQNKIKSLRKAILYITANNLFTVSPFSGSDPELVNFNGVYDAYGISYSRSFTLGIKLDL